jgi:hypothetical protein
MTIFIVVQSSNDGIIYGAKAYTSLIKAQEYIKQNMLNNAQTTTEYHFNSEQINYHYDIYKNNVDDEN